MGLLHSCQAFPSAWGTTRTLAFWLSLVGEPDPEREAMMVRGSAVRREKQIAGT